MKIACTVWSGGKLGDYLKELPITIDLIDKPQLQATAQVAKSYILDQDTANVNTIINALQQSGGGSNKQEGIITFTQTDIAYPTEQGKPTVTGTISYNGDGTLYKVEGSSSSTISNNSEITYLMSGSRPAYIIYAAATDNYTAAVFTY